MTGRLFRFTPHGGKPNHYTDSFRSAQARIVHPYDASGLEALGVGESLTDQDGGEWERVA